MAPPSRLRLRASIIRAQESLNGSELGSAESVACGSPPRRAYPPQWSCGREAEGGGLLNRYRVVKPYRGFESLRLRHPSPCRASGGRPPGDRQGEGCLPKRQERRETALVVRLFP